MPRTKAFWSQVRRESGTGCWEWTGSTIPKGYGQFRYDGDNELAHRISWAIANGPIPDGVMVCHHCDNRICVRPDHLFLGDAFDNMQDMVAKGRHYQRSQTHCVRGHAFTAENTRVDTQQRGYRQRQCRECCREATRRYRSRKTHSKGEAA